jgi:hypothetical protein
VNPNETQYTVCTHMGDRVRERASICDHYTKCICEHESVVFASQVVSTFRFLLKNSFLPFPPCLSLSALLYKCEKENNETDDREKEREGEDREHVK